ncbi:MAG TPA: hypothetical protein VMV79_08780, partial [Alphaproteobacteria bacterium]|nr:hypothetical protein [Alphaproteobacteria bacterium]
RRRYGLTVAGLKGAKGERLAGPYKLSFTVPDRPPSLAFVGDPGQGGLMRYQNADPVLRAVGIARVHIQLYRVEDPAAMAEAYRQRLQASLAPSESLAFARTHGKLMWQGEMALGEKNADPNRTAEQSVPLRAAAGALKPGLYLVAAETPAPEKTAKAKTAGRLPPLAAQWFLRSDLRLAALPAQGGFTAETENAAGTKVLKDVHLALSDRDRHILSESQSDKDGIGFLPLAKDKQAVLLAAADTQGDVDFVDLTAAPAVPFTLPALEATVTEDRVSYAPGAMAHLRLEARDIHGAAQGLKGSTLELLRPGGGFYAEVKVPDLDAGLAYAAFPAPPIEGLWQLVWQGKDQGEIAKTTLRVSANPAAPRIDLAADRAQLGPGGQLNLTVTSLGADHKPAPYIAGHILLHWDQPTALPGWPGYIFGTGTGSDEAPLPIAAFLTGADGTAHVRLAIAAAPADDAALQSAVLTAQGDPAMGALDSAPLALPLRAQTGVVGLKPLAPDGKFAENSLARFDVIALDGDGNRQDLAGLSYQVYEEGRRYSWYQADGHWQYKPLPQRQRIAGGVFAIPLQGTVIGWPVTAGAYTLDITDADGKLLARATAEAGWNLAKPEHAPAAPLTPKPSAPFAMPGAAEKISFRLDHASIVSAVIADDRIRKVIHAALPAGANSIAFTPGETWGNRIAITLDAHNGASRAEGRFEMPVHHNLKQLKISASPPAAITPGENLSLPVAIAGAEAGQPTYLSALAIPLPAEKNQTPESIAVKSVTVADGKAILHMTAPDFSGALRLDIMAVNRDQQGSTDVTIPVRPAFAATLAPPPILRKGDRAALALALANHAAPAGVFHYALIPAKGLALIGRVKGAESLALKRTAKIALDLEARGEGAQELRLDIKGPHNFGMARGWAVAVCDPGRILKAGDAQSIAPGQGWSLPQTKYGKRAAPYSLLLVSAAPLPGLPGLLPQLLAGAPVTTAEIAAWLEAARAWRDVIDEAGLAPGAALDARRAATLMRLLQRQNKDGAFPALSGGADDMDATASALVALAAADQPLTRPSAARAEDWLQGQLQNSWFNEAQRPARAAAFAALAAAGHQNLATLRYF